MNLIKKLENAEREAKNFGFYWPNHKTIIEQIYSEIREVEEELNSNKDSTKLQEEIGDLLHAVFSLCFFCGFDCKETLENSTNKFIERFQKTKYFAIKDDLLSLQGKSMEEMLSYWKMAKKSLETK